MKRLLFILIGLYIVFFSLPVLILGILNGLILEYARRRRTIIHRRLWSLVPILIMVLLAVSKVSILDIGIWSLGLVAIPAFCFANLLWNIKLKKN